MELHLAILIYTGSLEPDWFKGGCGQGERVLLKLWWDRMEIFSRTQERLASLPRRYTLKTQPIDWKGYFRIFIRKPRGARHATMYRFLPEQVRQYLEECDPAQYRERLNHPYSPGRRVHH